MYVLRLVCFFMKPANSITASVCSNGSPPVKFTLYVNGWSSLKIRSSISSIWYSVPLSRGRAYFVSHHLHFKWQPENRINKVFFPTNIPSPSILVNISLILALALFSVLCISCFILYTCLTKCHLPIYTRFAFSTLHNVFMDSFTIRIAAP